MDDMKNEPWFNALIFDLDLRERTKNALFKAGITTLGEALCLPERDLLRLPEFGRLSLNDLNGVAAIFDAPTTTRQAAARSAVRHIGDRIDDLKKQLAMAERSLERERAILNFGEGA